MDAHLSPSRLAADDPTDAERAHLAVCARCRMDLRRMKAFVGTLCGEPDPWFGKTVALADHGDTLEPDGSAPSLLPERYEDLGRIGLGGMGEVRRVRDRVLGRVLAMKIVSTHLADRPAFVGRFVEEGQVASQLQHPGIVPVHDVGRLADGRVWITMKEVRGQTFAGLIRDHHQPGSECSLPRLIEVVARVGEAVGYAHTRGVVHRDLKPQNVMVGAFGEVLVVDWGLAKVVGEGSTSDEGGVHTGEGPGATRWGTVLGTPAYMAPEQARGEVHRLGPAADVYALGSMIYEVLTGRVPYVGSDGADVLRQVVRGPPERPTGPEALVRLCVAAMAREPGDRPTGNAVAAAARDWLEGARRRAQALGLVQEAQREGRRARELRGAAAALRAAVPDLVLDLEAAWNSEDGATRMDNDADDADLAAEWKLAGALEAEPGLPEAHAMLADRYLSEHVLAERARDERSAARLEARLRSHLAALPTGHPMATAAAAYLQGLCERTVLRLPERRRTPRIPAYGRR